MLIKDMMNRNVQTIGPESTVQKAAELMMNNSIGSLIVVKDEKLAGIITERDVMKVIVDGRDPKETKIRDAMTSNVVFISPDKDVSDAAELMAKHKIKKLPVVEGSRLVGIVTATDLMAAEPKILSRIGALMLFTKRRKPIAG